MFFSIIEYICSKSKSRCHFFARKSEKRSFFSPIRHFFARKNPARARDLIRAKRLIGGNAPAVHDCKQGERAGIRVKTGNAPAIHDCKQGERAGIRVGMRRHTAARDRVLHGLPQISPAVSPANWHDICKTFSGTDTSNRCAGQGFGKPLSVRAAHKKRGRRTEAGSGGTENRAKNDAGRITRSDPNRWGQCRAR